MVQSMPYPNCAPTWEYVAMPLGSSSEAPVISPGPSFSIRMSFLPGGLLAAGDADHVAATVPSWPDQSPLSNDGLLPERDRGSPSPMASLKRSRRTPEQPLHSRILRRAPPPSGLWGGLSLCAALVPSAPPLLRPACHSGRTFQRPS